MIIRNVSLFTRTGNHNSPTSCCIKFTNGNCDHKFSFNKVVNYCPLLRVNSTKCVSDAAPSTTATSGGSRNSFGGLAKLDDDKENNRYDWKKEVFPFEKMPTAFRLPLIGTKVEFMLCGAGRKYVFHIFVL